MRKPGYLHIPCDKGNVLKIQIENVVLSTKSDMHVIEIYDTFSFGRCLFLNGVIQSAENDHICFDKSIVSSVRPEDQELLILGGGDGHTAVMALTKNPNLNITIVDIDKKVIEACQKYLDQRVYEKDNVNVVIEDATRFLTNCAHKQFDGIICDMTDIPLGANSIEDFYYNLYKLSENALAHNGWFMAYIGCNEVSAYAVMNRDSRLSVLKSTYIECFGEPCFFIHGNQNS